MKVIRGDWFWRIVAWLWPMPKRADDQCCGRCVRFEPFPDEEDPDGPDGYCGNDWNPGYGGHWTHSAAWCPMFKATGETGGRDGR
jgi:hypothetical protein